MRAAVKSFHCCASADRAVLSSHTHTHTHTHEHARASAVNIHALMRWKLRPDSIRSLGAEMPERVTRHGAAVLLTLCAVLEVSLPAVLTHFIESLLPAVCAVAFLKSRVTVCYIHM